MSEPEDEFGLIARLFRPLTQGAPEALDLLDDAAVIPQRPGFDLVVTKDAVVEGVHTPAGERRDLVARKLLRTNLSDLAAMAAEPYAAFLAVAWPKGGPLSDREDFARGLAQDMAAFGVRLLGGDTVSTDGPLVASLTLLGWAPSGRAVRRSGAAPGDLVLVSGPIGDGGLGLLARIGAIADSSGALQARYDLPEPRLDLNEVVRRHATACADVSDGLVADAWHIASASGVRIHIALDQIPVSSAASVWLDQQADPAQARLQLATAGDDYQLVLTAPPEAAARLGLPVIGEVQAGAGMTVSWRGATLDPGGGGWRHG